jgi:glycosyltransferase involved in cell wall biosynthesis
VITTIDRGGAENAVLALAKEQVRNNYEVIVLPLKGKMELASDLLAAGVTVDSTLVTKSFLKQIRSFRKKYLSNAIFHAHLPRSELLLLFSKSNQSFLVTRHNAEPFFPGKPAFLSRLLSRAVTSRTHSVIAISHAVSNFLTNSKEISKLTRISVIYYGYSRRCSDIVARDLVKFTSNRILRIGAISRLAPQKNLDLLVDLGRRLKSDHRHFQIQIVGDGPENLYLQNRIVDCGLEEEVILLGRKGDVMPFLQEQDVFVLTSNYEGFGLVLLEAMDANLPIIAPRNSAIPEVLGDKHPGMFETGNLESLYNTLLSVLYTTRIRTNMMLIQSRQLKFFSIQNYFIEHDLLYSRFAERM